MTITMWLPLNFVRVRKHSKDDAVRIDFVKPKGGRLTLHLLDRDIPLLRDVLEATVKLLPPTQEEAPRMSAPDAEGRMRPASYLCARCGGRDWEGLKEGWLCARCTARIQAKPASERLRAYVIARTTGDPIGEV